MTRVISTSSSGLRHPLVVARSLHASEARHVAGCCTHQPSNRKCRSDPRRPRPNEAIRHTMFWCDDRATPCSAAPRGHHVCNFAETSIAPPPISNAPGSGRFVTLERRTDRARAPAAPPVGAAQAPANDPAAAVESAEAGCARSRSGSTRTRSPRCGRSYRAAASLRAPVCFRTESARGRLTAEPVPAFERPGCRWRPLLDALWQSFGLKTCTEYDEHGA